MAKVAQEVEEDQLPVPFPPPPPPSLPVVMLNGEVLWSPVPAALTAETLNE